LAQVRFLYDFHMLSIRHHNLLSPFLTSMMMPIHLSLCVRISTCRQRTIHTNAVFSNITQYRVTFMIKTTNSKMSFSKNSCLNLSNGKGRCKIFFSGLYVAQISLWQLINLASQSKGDIIVFHRFNGNGRMFYQIEILSQ